MHLFRLSRRGLSVNLVARCHGLRSVNRSSSLVVIRILLVKFYGYKNVYSYQNFYSTFVRLYVCSTENFIQTIKVILLCSIALQECGRPYRDRCTKMLDVPIAQTLQTGEESTEGHLFIIQNRLVC